MLTFGLSPLRRREGGEREREREGERGVWRCGERGVWRCEERGGEVRRSGEVVGDGMAAGRWWRSGNLEVE